jgi:hypothetical protein
VRAARGRGDADRRQLQYVFEVFLEAGLLRVERKWPEMRDREMARFPSEQSLVGQRVSIEEFMSSTRSMRAQSDRDSCRYYVVITGNRDKMDRQMYSHFIRIQDHFYKHANIR